MTDSTGAYVIEIDEQTVGIVVPDEDSAYRFYASVSAYCGLEQRRFASPRAAQRAARALRDDRRPGRRDGAFFG